MAEPMAFKFWAPTPQQGVDASPLMEGAKASAAGMAAFGAGVGKALADYGDEKAKQNAQEAIADMMEEVGNDKNYEVIPTEPWMDDPSLRTADGVPLDRIGARAAIMQRLMDDGYDEGTASLRARMATETVPKKVLKKEAAAKLRGLRARAMSLAPRAGMTGADIERAVGLVAPTSYETDVDAQRAALKEYVETLSPAEEQRASFDAALRGKESARQREHEKQLADASRNARLEEIQVKAGIDANMAFTAFGRAKTMAQIESDLAAQRQAGKDERDFGRERDLLELRDKYETARMRDAAKLDRETRLAVEDARGKIDLAVAEAKSSGSLTPEQQRTAREFGLNLDQAAIEGSAFEPVPLSAVGALVGKGGVGDFFTVNDKAGTITTSVAFENFGIAKNTDFSSVVARIGANGEPELVDTTGKSGASADQLKAVAKQVFRSPAARDALVVQQVYGGFYRGANDVERLREVDSLLPSSMLTQARALLAQGARMGTKAPAGSTRRATAGDLNETK